MHSDDKAVNDFAEAMRNKLAEKRQEGRSGWEDCDPANLAEMLIEHLQKGDPVDIANFAMFLHFCADDDGSFWLAELGQQCIKGELEYLLKPEEISR